MAFDVFDLKTQLSDGAAAYTASGFAQVNAATQILDLGAALSRTDLRITGVVPAEWFQAIIDISAITVANSNDSYQIWVLGSNNSNMSNPFVLGGLQLGYGTLIPNGSHSANGLLDGSGSDSITGRYLIYGSTNNSAIDKRLGAEFVALYNVIAGTSASITYTARMAPISAGVGAH